MSKYRMAYPKILLRFSAEQLYWRNHVKLGDTVIEIADNHNPNEWSVEEAIVEAVHPRHTFYKLGDRVLIDYAVFTEGLYPELQGGKETRVIEKTDDGMLLWACSETDISRKTEVHAKISSRLVPEFSPNGNVVSVAKMYLTPFPDTILIDPPKKQEAFEKKGLIYCPVPIDSRENSFWAIVAYSNSEGIERGDEVYIKGGCSIPINSPNFKFEYVESEFVLAKKNISLVL